VSEVPPPSKPPLGTGFWIAFFIPIGITVLSMVAVRGLNQKGDLAIVVLLGLGLSILVCPLYCGIRLAVQWASQPLPRVLLGLVLVAGLGILYLSVALAGCASIL